MNLDEIQKYCSSKKGVSEKFPFDEKTLVIYVGSKMFLLTNINSSVIRISLKCDPMMSNALRQDYKSIQPGYHLNKKHWNTITLGEELSEDQIKFFIDMSYNLVLNNLKKSEKLAIEASERK